MNMLEAKFQIVTPMFLGGSDQRADHIRPASIKGALRFWWRALNWARCLQAHDGDEVQALRHLHAEEARLFGIAASVKDGKQAGGQGVFLLQVAVAKTSAVEKPFDPPTHGQSYLLGQGLSKYDKAKKLTECARNAIKERGTFTLKLVFRRSASTDDESQVRSAVKALELLGALGSRARHGMGSIASIAPMSRAEYVKAIQELLQPTLCAPAEPPFTAFSGLSRVDISAHDKDALRLLDSVGREQQLYRSYGRSGSSGSKRQVSIGAQSLRKTQNVEPQFTPDHHLIFDAINGTTPPQAPERVVFGLPHNYLFSSTIGKANVNYAPDENNPRRRSSPLLLHIHPMSDGGFVAVHTLLRAKFLPSEGEIRITVWRDKNKKEKFTTYPHVESAPQWHVLTDYLNRFTKNGGEVIHGKQ